MKHYAIMLSILIGSLTVNAGPTLTVKSVLKDDIVFPESAYLDADSGFLFLSQIREGGPKGKDGDGRISKLSADGTMIKNDWVTGLNAPKGIRSHGGKLWVSDIDEFVCIDIKTAKIEKTIQVEGAKFLNDVACGDDGTVYVSDMIGGRIHQYKGGKVSVLAEGEKVDHPNGLLVHKGKLIIAAWGSPIADDFSTKTPGRLLSLNLKNGKIKPITKKPLGNLDGVESDGQGGYYVTDWVAGKIFHVNKKREATLVQTLPKGSADHAFIVKSGLLIVPEMLGGQVTIFEVK